jgi:hypothetical protein
MRSTNILFAQMERSYRALAECDALQKGTPQRTTQIALSTWAFAG